MAKYSNNELIEKLQSTEKGTPQAKIIMSELWEQNENLVEVYTHKFTGLRKGDSGFEDMKQQAYFSFYTAAYTFDISRGGEFSTYLYYCTATELSRYYYNSGFNIRIPVFMQQRLRKCLEMKRKTKEKREETAALFNKMQIDDYSRGLLII